MKRRFRVAVAIALVCFAFGAHFACAQGLKLFGESGTDLDRLLLLKRVVYLVNENYVEPQRINAGDMFLGALKRLQEQIPEVRVVSPDSGSIDLIVNRERLKMSKEMMNVYSLTPALSKALVFTKKNLVSDVTDENLEFFAIQGILSTLDPHSIFLNKDMWEQTKIDTIQGSFGGVGIVIGLRNSKLTIISPLDDTPAARAGLKAGDNITRINDQSTINMDTSEAASLMRGPKDTPVVVYIMREGWDAPKEFKLIRALIKTQSVEYKELKDGIVFIRVKNFQANTTEDVRRYIKQASETIKPLRGVILDVRNDPGGLLNQAVELADLFVNSGTIVSTVNRVNKEQRREEAKDLGTFANFPMLVLANGGSASASEIVAGAIKYLDRGIVVGRRTFGKSSVQMLFDLPNDTALKLTVEKYLTANGQSLQNEGIVPDIQLDPARVDDEMLSLFGSSFHSGEEDLERHFESTNNRKQTPIDMPSYSLRYLSKKADEDMEYKPIKEPMQDYEIAFAWKMLTQSRFYDRKKMLKELSGAVEAEAAVQKQAIASALAKKDIPWATTTPAAGKGGKPASRSCQPPQVQIDVTGGADGVKAGTDALMQVKVTNNTKCTLTNFWAISQADNYDYFINQREFLFGTLPPQSTKTRSVKVKLPEFLPDRLMSFKLAFFEDETDYPLEKFKVFQVKGLKQPRFSYVYRLEDSKPGDAMQVADGWPQKGESLRLYVDVKNVGEGATKDNIVFLKNLSGLGINIKNGRAELGELKPGASKQVSFDFEIQPNFEKKEFIVELQVYDNQFLQFLTKKLVFNLEIPAPAGKYAATGGWLRVSDAHSVDVMSSATTEGWRLAELKPGSAVKALGKWGNYYKVALDDKNGSCKSGWVAATSLAAMKQVPAKLPGPVTCKLFAPPQISLAPESMVTSKVVETKFLNLKGKLRDSDSIKDLYIIVNKDKVFYQAYVDTKRDGDKPQKVSAAQAVKEADFDAILPLQKGVNNILIIARDDDNFFDQVRMVVLYKPEEAKLERLSLTTR